MGVLLSKKKNEKRQSFQVSAVPQDGDQTREEAAGPSDREDPTGKRRNEDDDSESQKSSEDEREPKIDGDDSENEEKDESKSDQEESASEDNEDKKNRSSSSASSKESKSSQEDEEKREGVEEEKDEEVEVKEGSVKDVVLAQTEVNLSYEKKVEKALVGDMDFEYPEKAKIVRIFTSSTFTDTSVERNTLMERVYPRLKSFCQERGYDFQVVDMRWGVRDESTDDHMTTELCMRELRACQKLSTGPNFIVSLIQREMQNPLYAVGDYPRSTSHMFAFLQTFLGQKYGYRPFPVKIHVTEFEKLLGAVDNQDDVALLKHWFWRDDNSVPAQYLLQPITSLLPHYRDYANEESRKKASAEWWTAFERMQVVLRAAADKALKNESERHKYYMSVTEDEIRRGIIDATGRDKHCFWFKRVITDIADFVAHPNAGKFVDKTWGNPSSVDESAQTLLANLREKDLPEALSNNSIIHYDVKWHTNGIDPSASQEHRQYIEKLCTDFYDTLTDRIERGIAEDQLTHTEDLLIEEVFQHGSFCRKKCEMFQGRDEFLTEVKDTILQKRIAVLHGESGCGKTSLMAKIAMDVKKWLGGESATVVTRFIGTTPDSSNARSLLHSICQQISKANVDSQGATVPQDMKSLLEFFPTCLKENASSKPIILVLDSLDQLSDDDGGREVDWVPKEIPKNVYMILSTLPGEKYICFPKLQEKYEASVLLEVPKMPVDTAKQILKNWFKSSGRQLQSEQEKIVLEAFEKCPLPLYLKLCFDEACRWKSYTTPSDTKLTPSIKGIIHDLLDRVERLHGKIPVSQALAYITASRNGLTEPELEDILSLDDVVLNDVYQYWTPPIRRLPPLLWIRIRSDIGDYLIERGADGARVINWYHRQFTEVARERYLGDEQAVVGIHSNMSEYFLGDWSDGVKKSYVDKEGKKMAVDRLVPKQPLMFDVSEEKPIFNLRKLSEVPHHLLHSKQIDKLKQDTLCNFEFLLAKVQGSSVEAVQQDFNAALTLHPDDREFDLLQKCFSLSAHALRQDPRQLSVQLIGRLYKYMQKQECPFLKKVLIAAHTPSVPAFIPNQQCLTPAGGSLINSISNEEFHGGIEHVNFTSDSKTIVTCNRGSEGLCLLYVDVKSGRRQRKVCFDSSDTDVNTCWCAKISKKNDDIFIASGSSANMYLINARTNKILQEYKPMKDQGNWFRGFPSVAFAEDDKLIVALGDSGVRIWETASGKLLHDVNVKGINVEEEFGSLDANGGLAVYCVRNTKTVHVLNVKTGEEVRTINVALDKEEIRGEMQDTKVKEIHLTSRKQLLVVSEASVKSQLKVYNAETGEYVLDLKEFGIGYNNRLIVTEDGKNAIAIRNNYELVKWEIHTGEPTIVARLQPAFGTYGRNGDVVATAGSDGVLRVYDTRENVDEDETDVTATTAGFADSIWTLTVAADNRHVIASCTVKMMPEIAVWDALAGVKVRSIKAMNFPQPLHMIDDKVGVGRMAVGEAKKDHFDHFKLLDFGQAKTTRVLQGKASKRLNAVGFIDKKNFMGLSRGRRNLKVWNVDTGKVVKEYKLGQKYRLEGILICKDGSTVICSQASFFVEQEDQTVPLLVFNTKTHGHKTMEPIKDEQLGLDGSAITEDGKYFILQLKNDQVSAIWNTETGKLMHTLEEGSSGRNMVAISSKSMLALTSHESLKVWEIQTGKLVHDLFATDIDKIYLNEEGTIAITSDSKGYQPPSFEAWDLIKGKKLASYTVDTNPFAICPLGDHIVFAAPASVTVTTLRLHIPGREEKKPALSSYGDHVELSEFKGMMGPCDPNDDDDDKDDDDGDIQ